MALTRAAASGSRAISGNGEGNGSRRSKGSAGGGIFLPGRLAMTRPHPFGVA